MSEQGSPTAGKEIDKPSRGFWGEVWRRFSRRWLAMIALGYVVVIALAALLAPAIVGTKPLVCYYKGTYYFPAMGYFNSKWENPVFKKDRFRGVYPKSLAKKDPDAWAIYPLVYQDPYRRVRAGERPEQPANPTRDKGSPTNTTCSEPTGRA